MVLVPWIQPWHAAAPPSVASRTRWATAEKPRVHALLSRDGCGTSMRLRESPKALSREVGVEIYRLDEWRERAVARPRGSARGLARRLRMTQDPGQLTFVMVPKQT